MLFPIKMQEDTQFTLYFLEYLGTEKFRSKGVARRLLCPCSFVAVLFVWFLRDFGCGFGRFFALFFCNAYFVYLWDKCELFLSLLIFEW